MWGRTGELLLIYDSVCFSWREKLLTSGHFHHYKRMKRKKNETQCCRKCWKGGNVGGKRHRSLATWLVCGVSRGQRCQHSPQWGSSGGGRTQPWHCSWYHMVPLRGWQPPSSASVPDWVEIMANCTGASSGEPEPTDTLRPDLERSWYYLDNCQNRIFKQYDTEW